MRKFLISVIGAFIALGAIAAGDNTPTSKSYVDAVVAQKQDKISANDGAPMVLTNTGTAGEYGTNGIYDTNGEYATQAQNLVDAATMNAGVQNAIDSEFQCVSWVDDDPTKDCLLMDVFGTPPQSILPREYTQLEYLESTGLECINSGVKATPITMIKAKFQIIGTPTKVADYGFLGSYTLPVTKYYLYLFNRSVDLSVYTSIGGRRTNIITDHDVHTLEIRSNGDYYLDETLKATNIYANSEPNDLEIGVFRPKASSVYMNSLASRFYHIELDNGETKRNMIPAKRKNDNVLGMYDTVSNTFFENACSGEFIGGPFVYLPQGE